jgi:hypothetical protein
MSKDFITKECIVIGAGITGIALGRWLRVRHKLTQIDITKLPNFTTNFPAIQP